MHHVHLGHVSIIAHSPVIIVEASDGLRVFAQFEDLLAGDDVSQDLFILRPSCVVLRAGLFSGY